MVDLLHPNRTAHYNDYFRGVRAIAPPKLLLVPAAIVVAAMIIPSGYLVLRAIGVGTEVIDILFRSRTMDILVRSLMLMLAVHFSLILPLFVLCLVFYPLLFFLLAFLHSKLYKMSD